MSSPVAIKNSLVEAISSRRIDSRLWERAGLKGATAAAPAVIDGERTISYTTLAAHAQHFASFLIASGALPGDRVALFLDRTAEYVVALYGIWRAGAVAVPVHESLKSRQVEHILRHSGARILVSEPRRLRTLDAQATSGLHTIEVPRVEPHGELDASDSWRAPLDGGNEPAAILYTSGSTGAPKGILISHQNLCAGAEIVAGFLDLRNDDRILSVLPFSFDYGLNQLLTAVEVGAALYLHRSPLPADICRALVQHRITGLAGVPALWIQLMQDHSPLSRTALPHLRYITNTGGVFPPALVTRYRETFPHLRIFLMYGLSEAFRSTVLPPDEVDRRPGSIGKAIARTEILVLDESGEECAPGVAGELVHSGPTVALGYYNDPVATARVFRPDPRTAHQHTGNGVHAPRVVFSGDMVRRDREGFLYFVGRRDQQIKRLGHRISPDEIEAIVQASGLVAEVVATAEPDAVAGQAVILHVVPRHASSFALDALWTYCRNEMPSYMQPSAIKVREDMPRTTSGKPDRQRVAV
jgi:acyl-CoA ligase (AMP-forming) (exosortase A-associated)